MAQHTTNPQQPESGDDRAREIHPVDLFPTWDTAEPSHVHRTPAQIYAEDFTPGVPDAEAEKVVTPTTPAAPQKPADSGGTVKS